MKYTYIDLNHLFLWCVFVVCLCCWMLVHCLNSTCAPYRHQNEPRHNHHNLESTSSFLYNIIMFLWTIISHSFWYVSVFSIFFLNKLHSATNHKSIIVHPKVFRDYSCSSGGSIFGPGQIHPKISLRRGDNLVMSQIPRRHSSKLNIVMKKSGPGCLGYVGDNTQL